MWTDEDGEIYTTETFPRVQRLTPDDRLVAQYDLGCRPRYFAGAPGGAPWLEVSCDRGLRSIDRERHLVQRSRLPEDATPWSDPTGLTYGPDGTLYVLDTGRIVALAVEH